MEKIVIQETNLYKMTQNKKIDNNNGLKEVCKISSVAKVSASSFDEAKLLVEKVESGEPQTLDVEEATTAIAYLAERGVLAQKVLSSNLVSTISMDKPNIQEMGREETLSILVECEEIIKKVEELEVTEGEQVREIYAEAAKANMFKIAVSKTARLIKLGILLAAILIGCILVYDTENVFWGILISFTIYIAGIIIVNKRDLKIHANENEANAQAYYTEHVTPLQEKLTNIQLQIEKVYTSGEIDRVIDVVGEEFCSSDSISELASLIKGRRADSLKEAINLYDDIKSRERMEEMQMAIKNASEKTAVEAAKQTDHMKNIEKNTHQAATAAKITAATSFGTYRNVKKIRKRIR